MKKKKGPALLILLGILLSNISANAFLNIFLDTNEVMKLLGVLAELYYVREGQVNNFAMSFVVPVPANVHDIAFTWQSLAGRPLPYKVDISSSNLQVLPRAILSIPEIGEIPTWIENFSINLKCLAVESVEVGITINLEVVLNRASNNITKLIFRRRKACLYSNANESVNEDHILLRKVGPSSNGEEAFIIGVIFVLLFAMTLALITYFLRARTKDKNFCQSARTLSIQHLQTNSFCKTYVASSLMSPVHVMMAKNIETPEELQVRIAELTVQSCRVRLSNLLQEGTFGRVYRGTYNENQDVLVKTVSQHASQVQVSLLLQEGMSLYGASHPGILSVLGVSIEDHTSPFILYPAWNDTHNLKMFLLEPSCARSVTTVQIVMISSQVSLALGHLHSHGVVHKDVATRNCFIDNDFHVKICDNSLSRDLFPADYNCLGDSENRPVKWMSLEALTHKHFSEASDSWAFGVFMWELCTFGKQPYAEIDPFEMEHYLKDGYRLAQPFNCPDELFTIMAYCWALLPIERPLFGQLNVCLSDFYSQLTRYI